MKSKKKLIWVYPPNNWKSPSHKTFVYGYSNPRAKLFVQNDEYLTPEKINIFPNGNFAKVISLPNIENDVRLIQILGKKRTIVKRKILAGADLCVCPHFKSGKHPGRGVACNAPTKKNMVIVIDPGHGGKEHGTHSPKGIPEKYFNLQIAKLLFNKLKQNNKNVYLTRTTDKFVSLKNRVDFARKKKCNLFISIHHNALPDSEDPLKHQGVGIYYTNDFVKPFAKKILFNVSKESGIGKYGIFKRNFFVTRPHFYKGVLIECGFLTHPIESEYVTRKDVQEKIVRGIVEALLLP